jgi:hypothetical protein
VLSGHLRLHDDSFLASTYTSNDDDEESQLSNEEWTASLLSIPWRNTFNVSDAIECASNAYRHAKTR